jgi:hypothetical protein
MMKMHTIKFEEPKNTRSDYFLIVSRFCRL